MNRDRWKQRAETSSFTYSQWLAKLTEEVGEVAREVAVLLESPGARRQVTAEAQMIRELEHVSFIAECMTTHVRRRMALHGT